MVESRSGANVCCERVCSTSKEIPICLVQRIKQGHADNPSTTTSFLAPSPAIVVLMAETPRTPSSQYSFPDLNFTRGDESVETVATYVDAPQRPGEIQTAFRVLPFLDPDQAIFPTAEDEYFLMPYDARRVILRHRGEQFAVRIPDIKVAELEQRLCVERGGRRLAFEYQGKRRCETLVLKHGVERIWDEMNRCNWATRDVRSVVLVIREQEELEKNRPSEQNPNDRESSIRSTVRSFAARKASRS